MTEAGKILVVHLTDIHARNETDLALARISRLAPPIGSLIEAPTVVVFAISGDVGFSGKAEQYEWVRTRLQEVARELAKWNVQSVHFVVSPGNHDCDFSRPPAAVREALLESVSEHDVGVVDIYNALAPSQKAFRSFVSDLCPTGCEVMSPLVNGYGISVAGRTIRFLCVNTSWSSRLIEHPGKLRMPLALLPAAESTDDLVIVVAHHPLNWFHPADAVRFSGWLDQNADVVLWGHEHRLDEFNQVRIRSGSSVKHQIGLPIDDLERCGFLVSEIDLDRLDSKAYDFEFVGNDAKLSREGDLAAGKNGARSRGRYSLSADFQAFMEDPGAGFTHPRVNRQICLSDLFVNPEFREHRAGRVMGERVEGNVSLDDLCARIREKSGRYVIFGAEQSGKSAFAKYLVGDVKSHQGLALYLDASLLSSSNSGEMKAWFRSAINRQFDSRCVELVSQCEPQNLIVILDGASSLPGGAEGAERVIQFLDIKSATHVVLTAENPAISLVALGEAGEDYAYWKNASVLELMPLGHKRRGELIRRWASLGRDPIDESSSIEAEVRQVKTLLDRMLGSSTFPRYPLFILALLQQLEGQRSNTTIAANGSHGYLFEALVSQAIDRHVRAHEISVVNDFLAALAIRVWQRKGSDLTAETVESVIDDFRDQLVELNGVRLFQELVTARVLANEGGLIRFRYPYLYYYYLAKWACGRVGTPEANSFLDEMIGLIHTEQSSNVLMFVAYLKQEQEVLERLLPMVDGLFSATDPMPLESYAELSHRFRSHEQRAVLLQGPAAQVSDEHHRRLDRVGSHDGAQRSEANIEDALKLNSTLKALQTMGQILKSRATAIPPEQKVRIARTATDVSKRLMSFLYEVTESHAESIVRSASAAFEKAFKVNREEAVSIANSLIGAVVVGIARTCMVRAADVLAAAELRPLLNKLSSDCSDDDLALVYLVARIIGQRDYPKEAVESFMFKLKKSNVLPAAVLSAVVARQFYLVPPERAIRDSACNLLGIDVRRIPGPPAVKR